MHTQEPMDGYEDDCSRSGSHSSRSRSPSPRGTGRPGESRVAFDMDEYLTGAGDNVALNCRFCSMPVTYPNKGMALRICQCTLASRYMAHRGCFYEYMLLHGVPPVCPQCQAAWTIPPAEYLPFYYHRKRARVHETQRLAMTTLLTVLFFLLSVFLAALLVKFVVYVVSGSPVYTPFGARVLEVHWQPNLGDMVVGTIANALLVVAAVLLRALFRYVMRHCACATCAVCAQCCGDCPAHTDDGYIHSSYDSYDHATTTLGLQARYLAGDADVFEMDALDLDYSGQSDASSDVELSGTVNGFTHAD